jgi:predicted lipid-binding transport protein (Tim44 family)
MIANNLAIPTFWDLLSPILIASALIGAVVGLLSLGFAELFGYLSQPLTVLLVNRFSGGLLGGLLAGLITGPLGTLYFGLIQWPVLHPAQMLAGALLRRASGFAIRYFGRSQFTAPSGATAPPCSLP